MDSSAPQGGLEGGALGFESAVGKVSLEGSNGSSLPDPVAKPADEEEPGESAPLDVKASSVCD